jgi:integrase
MATPRLTELAIQKARPPAKGQIELWDGALPGLGLRISAGGTKAWVLVYRMHGRPRRFTFGRWPMLGLINARKAARKALGVVEAGMDPAAIRAENRERNERDTFEAVVSHFIERYAKPKNRSWRETERLLQRELVPLWRRRPIATISRRDVIEALDAIVDRGAPVIACRTLAAVRKLFNWSLERGIIEATPVTGIGAPASVESRDRVLDDEELAAVWRACDGLRWPFGPMFKLLILTGQRRDEVASMLWRDLDFERRIWTLPREVTKSDRAHIVPLSPLALDLLSSLPRLGEGYVFPSRRQASDQPASGFSHAKARLDRLSGVKGWRLHDLRRTVASGMARLGVLPHVIERVLNHVTGSLGGVAGVYNRFGYEPEMRRALDAWGQHVEGLLWSAPAKVVRIHA